MARVGRQPHFGAPGHGFAHRGDIFGPLHEGETDPIDALRQPEFEIGLVLIGECGNRQCHVGDVDAFAVRNQAGDDDFGLGEILAAGFHAQPQVAVVHQQRRARFQGGEDLGMGQADAGLIA